MRRLIFAMRLWRDKGLRYTWRRAWRRAGANTQIPLQFAPNLFGSVLAAKPQPAVGHNTGSASLVFLHDSPLTEGRIRGNEITGAVRGSGERRFFIIPGDNLHERA